MKTNIEIEKIVPFNTYTKRPMDVSVFLAGGLVGCPNWQDMVISDIQAGLSEICDDSSISGRQFRATHHYGVEWSNVRFVVINPRQQHYDESSEKNGHIMQLRWETTMLEKADIFSMLFCDVKTSQQPGCFFEIGRYLERKVSLYLKHHEQMDIGINYDAIIDYQKGFVRGDTIDELCSLMTEGNSSVGELSGSIEDVAREHAKKIVNAMIVKAYGILTGGATAEAIA
jgi:hypothetical protein